MLRTKVVRANAARPSGPGSATLKPLEVGSRACSASRGVSFRRPVAGSRVAVDASMVDLPQVDCEEGLPGRACDKRRLVPALTFALLGRRMRLADGRLLDRF